jgi:hypothetical protein
MSLSRRTVISIFAVSSENVPGVKRTSGTSPGHHENARARDDPRQPLANKEIPEGVAVADQYSELLAASVFVSISSNLLALLHVVELSKAVSEQRKRVLTLLMSQASSRSRTWLWLGSPVHKSPDFATFERLIVVKARAVQNTYMPLGELGSDNIPYRKRENVHPCPLFVLSGPSPSRTTAGFLADLL